MSTTRTATDRLTFDVFGRRIIVEPAHGGWNAFYPGTDGKRRPADFFIPSHLDAPGITGYLGDLFHEHATSDHPDVRML